MEIFLIFVVFPVLLLWGLYKLALYDNRRIQQKKEERLSNLNVSLDEEKKRRETLLKEITEAENKDSKLTYDLWVKKIEEYKPFENKEYIHLDNVGLFWIEDNKYYLYLIYATENDYKLGYKDGLIVSDKAYINKNIFSETTKENNKLKGAIIGGIVAGPTGAIVGQNVENKETTTYGGEYYTLHIDEKFFVIQDDDYPIIKHLLEKKKDK